MTHLEHLLSLLQQEKEEDLQQFIDLVQKRPLAERVNQGYTWYPVKPVKTGFSIGDKAYLVVERTTHLNEPHQLRAGMSARLFSQAAHVENGEKTGVIQYIDRNSLRIVLNARDVPDWLEFGMLGVDMLFDDRSYQEMERALKNVSDAKGNRLAELRRLFEDASLHKQQESLSSFIPEAGSSLNESQQRAVAAILANRDVAIIHGPPGTGKTTTLVAAVARLSQKESTILVTAPSNTAADLLTERLHQASLQVVRIGNVSRVDESVWEHTLEVLASQHPEAKNVRKVKLQAAEFRRQSRKFKRNFGYEERRERAHLKEQAKELEAWAATLEDRIVDQILSSADAIVSTLVGAANPVLHKRTFATCVIDEAAQALEPACWIPIAKCSKVVLAGDPHQLPPTVKSIQAARNGLATTLMERAIPVMPQNVHLLTVQYRMHQAIMNFSNHYFYQGALQAAPSVQNRRLLMLHAEEQTITLFDPVCFIDTAGCGFEEKTGTSANNTRALSRYNPEEALLIREHLLQVLQLCDVSGQMPSIGILSPYREQINCLEEILRDEASFSHLIARKEGGGHARITVNTIDGFQGQERDIIYISLVRSNPKNEIGFLSDYRRMNVAMTRARQLLVVVGDSATIGNNSFYSSFLEYCEKNGQYQTAWVFMK